MIASSKQANYASKTESVLNRTVCSNLNINHTSGTEIILKKLGTINNLYRKTVQKASEPFDVPVKNVKSHATAKVSVFVLHKVNKQSNHPKTKAWHIIFILQWIYARGIIIFIEASMNFFTLFP